MFYSEVPLNLATIDLRPSVNAAEKSLLMAILVQAVGDLAHLGRPAQGRDVALDARNWFFSQETYPGSLLWVCSALEIKPEPFRQLAGGLRSEDRRTKKEMKRVIGGLRVSSWDRLDG